MTDSLITSPIDAASIPLVDYADNYKVGFKNEFAIEVFGDDESILFDKKVVLCRFCCAPLIGEWVGKNCTEDLKKYLLMAVSNKQLVSGKVPNF